MIKINVITTKVPSECDLFTSMYLYDVNEGNQDEYDKI